MTSDVSLWTPVMMVLAAAALGSGIAWLRPDLDLRPRRTAAESALVAAIPAAALFWLSGSGAAAILFAVLAPLAVLDFRRMVLPDLLTFPLIAIGITAGLLVGTAVGLDRAIGAAAGYGSLRALGYLWERWRGIDAVGQGDAKLLAAIGAFVGWQALPEVALIAALTAIAVLAISGPLSATRAVPFGPPLGFAAVIEVLFGRFLI